MHKPTSTDVLFHHYPQSPVSEKVRVVFGMKQLAWYSVEIPRIPPKPDLMPLTGGYRRTPVMQIGADIYCDSIGIIAELERRYPTNPIVDSGQVMAGWGASRWTDGELFTLSVGVVLGSAVADLPPEFANDRGRLYFGPDFDLAAEGQDLAHKLAQIRARLSWIERDLADGRAYIGGERPRLEDALTYYITWFLRGRYAGGPALLEAFPKLLAWEQRVLALGHGDSTSLSSATALELAVANEPQTATEVLADDPLGLVAGQAVIVVPDGDGGDPAVRGELVVLNHDTIAIARHDPRAGNLVVHFPRAGYRVSAV
ncbi:MAG: glutathione S-transferase [Pseudomonadota bacterium]